MKILYHKKNELQEVEFYQDKECTVSFDFVNLTTAVKQLKYTLYIHKHDISPWANIYDYNNNRLYSFRPYNENSLTIDKANKFMKKNKLPLFDILKYHMQDSNDKYYHTHQIINANDNLYIELEETCVNPLISLGYADIKLYSPYLPRCQKTSLNDVITLDDITPNFSQYIPKDNAVLFLNADYCEKYMECFQSHYIGLYANDGLDKVTLEGSVNAINEFVKNPIKKLTIFLTHGTQSEIQKANEIGEELKEKYGVEEVNLFALHWFGKDIVDIICYVECDTNFNKIITTNSTGILRVQDDKRLQVIDCKKIFEEYLKEELLHD